MSKSDGDEYATVVDRKTGETHSGIVEKPKGPSFGEVFWGSVFFPVGIATAVASALTPDSKDITVRHGDKTFTGAPISRQKL